MAQVNELPAPIAQNAQIDHPYNVDDETGSIYDRMYRWIENDERNAFCQGLRWLHDRTGFPKWRLFQICALAMLGTMIRTPMLAPLISNSLCVAMFSTGGTLSALAFRRWKDVSDWLVYWIVYETFSCLDFLSPSYLLYLPVKTLIMIYMHWPPLFGARKLRRQWIDPLLYHGSDEELKNIMKQANPVVLKFFDLDADTLNGYNSQQLQAHVQEKKNTFVAKLFGWRVDGNDQRPNVPSDQIGTENPAAEAPAAPGQDANGAPSIEPS